MKGAWLIALITGVSGAFLMLLVFALVSMLINGDIASDPRELQDDDVGFSWLMIYCTLLPVIITVTGPVSVIAAWAKIGGWKDALAVPVIACTTEVALWPVAIKIYMSALYLGNLLPYFQEVYPWRVESAENSYCLPLIISIAFASAVCGLMMSLWGVALRRLLREWD